MQHFKKNIRISNLFISFLILTLLIVLIKCSKNITPSFETQVYMPLGRGTYTVMDLIYAFAPDSLYIDTVDSNVTFFYKRDTILNFISPSQVFTDIKDTLSLPPVIISFDSLFDGVSEVNISQVIPELGDTPGVYTIEPFATQLVKYIHLSQIDSAYYKIARFRLKVTNNPWVPMDTIVVRGIDSISGNLLFKGEFSNLSEGEVLLTTFQSLNKWVHPTLKLKWRFVNHTTQPNIYLNPTDVFMLNFWSDSTHIWRGSLGLSSGEINALFQDTMNLLIPINLQSATMISGTLSTTGINGFPLSVNYSLKWVETGTYTNFNLLPQTIQSFGSSLYGLTYESNYEQHNTQTFTIEGVTQPSSSVYIDTSQTLTTLISLSSIELGSVSGELRQDLNIPLPSIKFTITRENSLLPSGFLDIPGATMIIKPVISSTFQKSVNVTLRGINIQTGETAETTMVASFHEYAVFSNLGSVFKVSPDTIIVYGYLTLSGTGDLILSPQIPLEVDIIIPLEVELTNQVFKIHHSTVYLKDPDASKILKNSQLRDGKLLIFYESTFAIPFDLVIYMKGKRGFIVKKSGFLNPGTPTPSGIIPTVDTLTIFLKKKDLKIFKQFPIDLRLETKSSEPGVYTLYGNSRLSYSIWVNLRGRLTP